MLFRQSFDECEVLDILLWLKFSLCAIVIVFSGTQLSKYGDILAEKTGLGRSLIGVILMASVTSLPELITGISAVTIANVPDIAVGDVLGSCAFNLLVLCMLDAMHRGKPILASAHQVHILSAAFGIVLLAIAAISIIFPHYNVPILWVGGSSILVAAVYLLALKFISSYETRQKNGLLHNKPEEITYTDITVKQAAVRYVFNAAVVIAAAAFLPVIGKEIAVSTGLGQTFVGNIFMALASSLPEVVVCFAAVRIGAIDLAIGSIFGSNIFNIFILFIDDLFYIPGPLLAVTSPTHIIPAIAAITMTAIAIIGLVNRDESKYLPLAGNSIAMVAVFAANIVLLYLAI